VSDDPVVSVEAKDVDTRDGDGSVPADVCKGAVFVDHCPYDPVRYAAGALQARL
jgi:hypothetical protein